MGVLSTTRPDDLAAMALRGVLQRVPSLDPAEIDDVILGCSHPEGEQGWNIGRFAALRAGLPVTVPGLTVNRLCGSGLEAIAQADLRIRAGDERVMIAGGAESMSMVPMGGLKPSPNPWLIEKFSSSMLTMGQTAERVAQLCGIRREDQDAFALESHRKALSAQAAGRFAQELIPVTVLAAIPAERSVPGKPRLIEKIVSVDEGPRASTTAEVLARLKPAFASHGAVTAGNSSPTSDGAAALLLMEAKRAGELGIRPLGRMVSYAVTGCVPEEMGMGPATAIPKALKRAGLHLHDIGLIELNEAFAATTLAVMRALDLDPGKVNVNGGAIALGHPLGCTGAKLTASLLSEMQSRDVRYGLVSLCIGSGMGVAAVFERL
jgi:acetyl-CoA acyltransferase